MVSPHLKRSAIAVAVGAATLASSQLSLAANALLEEVTVTATRRATSTTDVPYNISATSSEQLEQLGITDFTKLARNTPGLTFIESGARNSGVNSGLIIRGLNTRSTMSNDIKSLQDPTVSTYLGETPLFANFILKDIDRVEILRGPQGTLYGSGSLGGTLRYIPKKPSLEGFEGEVSSKLGSTNHGSDLNNDTYAVINVPLSDRIALRAVSGYVENAGFIDAEEVFQFDANGQVISTAPGGSGAGDGTAIPVTKRVTDSNGDDSSHLRVSVLWEVNDVLTATLTHNRQKDNAQGVQGEGTSAWTDTEGDGQTRQTKEYAHYNRILEPLEREIELTALDLEADLGFATLSSSTAVTTNEALLTSDQSGIYHNQKFNYSLYYNAGPTDVTVGDSYTQDDEQFAQEIRLVSNTDGPLSWVGGIFYRKQEMENRQYDRLANRFEFFGLTAEQQAAVASIDDPKAQKLDTTYYQKQVTELTDLAVFGELSYEFTDRLRGTLGVRAFNQKYDSQGDIYLIGCSVTSQAYYGDYLGGTGDYGCGDDPADMSGKTGGALSLDVNDVISKLNVSYDVTEEASLYFTRSEGFRHGGTNGIPLNNVPNPSLLAEDPALANYQQDTAVNYELGIKGNAMDGRMKFAAALYYITWDDIQIDAGSPNGGFPIIVNGKGAESKGVELESTIGLSENLTLTLGYTFTQAELTDDFNAAGIVGRSGDALPNVPEHSASWSINHFLPLSSGLELSSNLSGNYVSEAASDLNPDSFNYAEYDGYSILNASIGLGNDVWNVGLFVDNLLDEHVITNPRGAMFNIDAQDPALSGGFTNPQSGRELYGFINRPRTAGLNAKYKF